MEKKYSKRVIYFICFLLIIVALFSWYEMKLDNKQAVSTLAPSNIVTIRFMSDLTDRNSGQGKIEQMIADNYTKEYPNIKIEFEILEDETYHEKFRADVSVNDVPDIFTTWQGTHFSLPAKVSAELNPSDFKNYGFKAKALVTRMVNGKLYGLPRNNDMNFLYYNRDIFIRNHLKIPATFQELLVVTKKLRDKGIIPCAINGKDKYELPGLYDDIYFRVNPDPQKYLYDWNNAAYEKDPFQHKAAKYYKQLMDAGFFQNSFESTDYGTAKSLFTEGVAAMYYMGSWELSMSTDPQFSEKFRNNIGIMEIPPIQGERSDINVLSNWYGAGYSVNSNSKVKKEAIDFLKYFFKPENWPQLCWDNAACVAAQKYKLNGKENNVMKAVHKVLQTTNVFEADFPVRNDAGSYSFGIWDTTCKFSLGLLTQEQYLKEVDNGLKKGYAE